MASRKKVGKDNQSRAAYTRQRQWEGLTIREIADELEIAERHLYRILQDARGEAKLRSEMIASR